MSNLYWLSEAQMERLRPFFPKLRSRSFTASFRLIGA